jgi:hypothetical protein
VNSDFAVHVHLAVDVLVFSIIGLIWIAPHLERAFGRGGGRWRDLARNFATTQPMPGDARPRQTVLIGPALYRASITVGAGEAGLFLAPGPPASIFLKQRLLIPWAEIVKTEPAATLWGKATTLIVGAPALATVTVPADLFEKWIEPNLSEPDHGRDAKQDAKCRPA